MARRYPRKLALKSLNRVGSLVMHENSPIFVKRAALESVLRPMPVPRGTHVTRLTLAGRPAERISHGTPDKSMVVLYLHGGGYTIGSARAFRSLASHLSRASGAVVYTLDYRLAPEHPFPAALDDATAAVLELANKRGHSPARIALCGDSAGGGLAVATARELVDRHDLGVAVLGLISPWTDPASAALYRPDDTELNRTWSALSATAYRAGADPRTPGFAPVHGDLSGLPPMVVHYGKGEVLERQIGRFVAAVHAAGGEAELTAYRVTHSGHAMAAINAEAARATHDLGVALQNHLRQRTH